MREHERARASGRAWRPARTGRCRSALTVAAALIAVCGLAPSRADAQVGPRYMDPGAEALHRAAQEHHLAHADLLVGYDATLRQRIGIRLRLPLRDRTLYHAESAHRVLWRRDGPVTIAALGIRETTPGGPAEEVDFDLVDAFWDPARDRLLLGERAPGEDRNPDDLPIEHPLEPSGAEAYRFASGDTVTLALPDGRRLRVVELRMVPRVRAPARLVGSLWIEPESGALVRAVYRMSETLDVLRDVERLREENERGRFRWVPGLFKPWTFDITVVTVDYFLWEGGVWLPLRWRAEGIFRAGVVEAPGELDRAYRFTWVGTEGPAPGMPPPPVPPTLAPDGYRVLEQEEARERDGVAIVLLVPEDPRRLRESPELPPPVWDDAPGFVPRDEIGASVDHLDGLPVAPAASLPTSFVWGLEGADLVRFNRVEELSIGARGEIFPNVAGRPVAIAGTVRLGSGDRHPNARVELTRRSLRRTVGLSAYHELTVTEAGGRHLGLGNSVMAFLFGRDDGDYYRRSGGALALGPPAHERRTWWVEVSTERHETVGSHTRVSLARLWKDDGWAFRPNVDATEGWEHALTVGLSRATRSDPTGVQAGATWTGTAAAGSLGHFRSSLGGRLVLPLGADFRIGAAAWGGAASTDVPAQRAFVVGGPATLRGYAPRTRTGPCGTGGTIEVQRRRGPLALTLFLDGGWAGACDAFRLDAALGSAGVGISLMDGLVRADLARGLEAERGFRFDLYLDGVF